MLTALAIGWAASCGRAEVVTVDSEDPQEQHGFEFVLQSSDVLEVLDDFDRYCGRGDWDRAFKNLEKLQEADRAKMLRDKQGFVRPVGARLQLSLARLSPAGRAAFRLFYDAEAKQRLAAARGEDELAQLTEVFHNYFASSVGDEAADRLGDLHFERGEMAQAAGCWQAVLQDHPDSALSRLRLLTKTALASARGGNRQRFDELRQLITERYTGQTVVLGGRTVDAAEYLATVSAGLPPMNAAATVTMADFELPQSGEPLWKFNFYSAAERERLESSNNNWNARLPIASSMPPLALDAS
ncbi:MAG TPA: hypothetical protein VHY20_01340, partial [Pirellulales bacterium]|nr:hypothetical protein [Pirellulales bacterium]